MTDPQPELSEKDFINESYSKDPFPLWNWLFVLAALMLLIWGISNWYSQKVNDIMQVSPFLQVTNRELSLFLWENPEYMRINSKEKNGYLPAFQYVDKVTIDPPKADEFTNAPPEVLFRYHTWNRLLSGEFSSRPISPKDFLDFLSYVEEWQPEYWSAAPHGYAEMVKGLAASKVEDLSTLPKEVLPQSVRMAFQGWKNYFMEGDAINSVQPTVAQMRKFLSSHPHFARNYWRNLVEGQYPNYLKSLKSADDSLIPTDELAGFLRVAFFNNQAASVKANSSSDNSTQRRKDAKERKEAAQTQNKN